MQTKNNVEIFFVTFLLGVLFFQSANGEIVIFDEALGECVTLDFEVNPHATIIHTPLAEGGLNASHKVIRNIDNGEGPWEGLSGRFTKDVVITEDIKKLYLMFYNPSPGSHNYQVQLDLIDADGAEHREFFSGSYDGGSWQPVTIDLSSYIEETLTWFWVSATAGAPGTGYFDNIYLGVQPPNNRFSLFDDTPGPGVVWDFDESGSPFDNPSRSGINTSLAVIRNVAETEFDGVSGTTSILITNSNKILNISFYNEVPGSFAVHLNFGGDNVEFQACYIGGLWQQKSIDLSVYIGETLTWLWVTPTAEQTGTSYFDQVYLSSSPSISSGQIFDETVAEGVTIDFLAGSQSTFSNNPRSGEEVNENRSSFVICHNETGDYKGITFTTDIEVTEATSYLHVMFYSETDRHYEVQLYFEGDASNTSFLGSYESGLWQRQIVDLSAHIGKRLTWLWIAPSQDEPGGSYVDNLFLSPWLPAFPKPLEAPVITRNLDSFAGLHPGIPLLTFDQARQGVTELSSEYDILVTPETPYAPVQSSIVWANYNPHLQVDLSTKSAVCIEIFKDAQGEDFYLDFFNNRQAQVVNNPLPAGSNTSDKVIVNTPISEWQGLSGSTDLMINADTTFTAQFYNPGGARNYQVQFLFECDGDGVDGEDREVINGSHDSDTENWTSVNISLAEHAGKKLIWFNILPSAAEQKVVYFDELAIIAAARSLEDVRIAVSTFSTLDRSTRLPLPNDLKRVRGVAFSAKTSGAPIDLVIRAKNESGRVLLRSKRVTVTSAWQRFTLPFLLKRNLGEIDIRIALSSLEEDADTALFIDDMYLLKGTGEGFQAPEDDAEFFSWLKQAALRHFIWYYCDTGNGRGVVAETSVSVDRVSISGLGMSLAALVLAEKERMLTEAAAEQRTIAILRWISDLDVTGTPGVPGESGFNGFAYHYLNKSGTSYVPDGGEISTIDSAICAFGVRLAAQRFADNAEMQSLASTILERPQWASVVGDDKRIALTIRSDGELAYRWGLAFSEETELVVLAALASGDINHIRDDVLSAIIRDKKDIFYQSWFGAGFTYNWLQIWTGSLEQFATNSRIAFLYDFHSVKQHIGIPVMGLTATSVIEQEKRGYLSWSRYISNQGSIIHGVSDKEVVRYAPAPYGAVLAYPFVPEQALSALRTYVDMGFYHPLLGLPESVQMKNLPSILDGKWAANYERFDINLAASAMAIEQAGDNLIGSLLSGDTALQEALLYLLDSIP